MNQLNVKRFYQLSEKSQIDDPSNLYVVGVENETNCKIPSTEFLTKNIVKSVNSSEDLTLNGVKNNSDCLFVIGTNVTELDLSGVIPSTMNSITVTFTLTLDESNTNEVTIKNVDEILGKLNQSQKNLSGKIIKDSTGNVYISVFKYALGEEGNDWITVNDAGEAVLNFPDETNPTIENIKLGYSAFTKVTGTTGGKIDFYRGLCGCPEVQEIDLTIPKATSTGWSFMGCSKLIYVKVKAPLSTDCYAMFMDLSKLETLEVVLPSVPQLRFFLRSATNLRDFIFNFSSLSTINFAETNEANLTGLQNVTVLEGGLASCTSFIITNSTSLTDESIQNIIDALPDYSGTETSALVSFPPDRLTAEQQTQLNNKGWTWS